MAVGRQFHVLAVDDSIIDRKLIERLLKTSSFQVTAVDSASKALEFLGLLHNNSTVNFFTKSETLEADSSDDLAVTRRRLQRPRRSVSMIITDYSMPGMTGHELLKKIKESKHLWDIPVVIMSSENIPSRINRCLEDGAQHFLLKPVQMCDLHNLINHQLNINNY